jgi:hypothetical protein
VSPGDHQGEAPGGTMAALVAGGRRVLVALGIGLLATVTGSAAGGGWFALMGMALDGFHGLMASPGIVLIGLVFGPLYAAPVTLVALPLVWVLFPRRWERTKGMVLLLVGPLVGAVHLWRVLPRSGEIGVMGWVLLGAGTVGGLAAGLTFRAFCKPPLAR